MTIASWPLGTHGLSFGGDYNPEQWPEEVWAEDVALMREAGVDLVTVGVFSWARLEPEPGRFEPEWLDRVLDLLHDGGIRVDLATATASPPPWLSALHPQVLPQAADGSRRWPGGRQAFCPSSPVYLDHALSIASRVAERYRDHPALAMWHVSNEIGCHNAHCYCDVSAEAFRRWLQRRYGDLDALNDAWGTAFWSQHYSDWSHVLPPRLVTSIANPTQQLDFYRFSSDALLDTYRAERDLLRRITPDVPVTTNFMVMRHVKNMDYWSWAPEMDVVSNDHYLTAADPDAHVELAFSADLTRSLARGRPWLLMEHSTSAVNWQPRNVAKRPGQLSRNSLAHVARGADAALFFQWRASRAGAEKFHSALLPHAGTESRLWREVCQLGAHLAALAEVRGSTVSADVALLFDWNAWWAAELDAHPSVDVTYLDRLHAHYRALWDAGVTVGFAHPDDDLSGYRLVIVPTLYSVTDDAAKGLRRFVEAGGTALVTYFSGIVDEVDHVRSGGFRGAFGDLLGVVVEEFCPLLPGDEVRLDDGSVGTVWTEDLRTTGAQVVASYVDGPVPGVPAVTRNAVGDGAAWYVATRLDSAAVAALTQRLLAEAGIEPVAQTVPGVEVVRRRGESADFLFVINHTGEDAQIAASGAELLTGREAEGTVEVPAGGVAVIRESSPRP